MERSLSDYGRVYFGGFLRFLEKPVRGKRLLLTCLLTSLLVGLAAHGFMFANKLYSSADELFYYRDVGTMYLDLGRYGLQLFYKLGSYLSMPWFIGICGLTFCGLAAAVLCSALELRQTWQALLVAAVLVAHPVIMTAYTYMFLAMGCMAAILCCACALWCLCRVRHGWALAAPLIMFAVSIYQVFIMFAAMLMILCVLRRALRLTADVRALAAFIGKALLSLALGLVCYLALNKLMIALNVSAMMSQQGMDKMGSIELAKLPHQIALAYGHFFDYYFLNPLGGYRASARFLQAFALVASAVALLWCAALAFRRRQVFQGLVILGCLAVLPMVASGVYLLTTNEVHAHHHTLYPYIALMLLPTILPLERLRVRRKKLGAALLALCVAVYGGLVYEYSMLDNQAYFRTYYALTRAEHFANRLIARIEGDEAYRPGMKVYFVGQCDAGDNALIYYDADDVMRFSQMMYYTPYEQSFFQNCVGQHLLRNVMGMPIDLTYTWSPTPEEKERVAAMPCYPAEGGVALMRDTYIVKFSDEAL